MKVAMSIIALLKRIFAKSLWLRICVGILLTITLNTISFSSPIKNYPKKLVQPDGDTISVLLTGDEYYNWVHDIDNYTIIQDQTTGYYVYADIRNDELVPTKFVVGKFDPVLTGLSKGINISGEKMLEIRNMFLENSPEDIGMAPNSGTINALVVFIRFSDEPEFNDSIMIYQRMFNDSSDGANSLYNYYKEVSYNALLIVSTFYPMAASSIVVSYQDSHPRGYYQPYSSTNTIGYTGGSGGTQRITREHTLLMNASNYIAAQVPTSLILDGDNDGNIDNMCFIVSGEPGEWNTLLWPHMWALYSFTVNINGKRVYEYQFQLQNYLKYSYPGVAALSHETFHMLGAPDLYRYTTSGYYPVGYWDLMDLPINPPQHFGAYMKYRYGGWIDTIPTISNGTYFLHPLTSSTNNCYRINSPNSTTEYFIVEYRKKEGTFEGSLPGSGLLVYRINTLRDGQGNANGPPDEVYVYRPDGTLTQNGNMNLANYSAESGRRSINNTTNPSPFLSNGNQGGLEISNVGFTGDSIVFILGTYTINITSPTPGIFWSAGTQKTVNWTSNNVSGNLDIKLSTDGGNSFEIDLALNTPNDGSETIVVPNLQSENCKVMVGSSSNQHIYGLSGGIFLISPLPSLISPLDSATNIQLDPILSWDTCSWANSYTLQVSTNSNFTTFIFNQSGLTTIDLQLTGLNISTTYYWRVNATNGSITSDWSTFWSFTTTGYESFTEQTSISLTPVDKSSVAWGDYDNDGDLDILLTGDSGQRTAKIYRNNGNSSFTEQTSIVLRPVYDSMVDWGDYDNDGDLDIILSGSSSIGVISMIFRNNGNNTFTEQTDIIFGGYYRGSVDWGDYDNDGDLDILLSGQLPGGINYATKIFKNNGNNTFTQQTGINLTGVGYSSAAWGDYDNDGDLDILLTGYNGLNRISKVYRNNSDDTFMEMTSISLIGVSSSSVAWGDYDNDGDLDILFGGYDGSNRITKIYRNDEDSIFTEIASLVGAGSSSVAWGDYDNDGDLDILLTGTVDGINRISEVYRNNGDNTFSEMTSISLIGVSSSSVAWGDYDNDGDLDIIMTGNTGSTRVSKIYRNNAITPNTKPTPPSNLMTSISGEEITFKWNKSQDNETPQDGLRYNLVIGTISNGLDVLSPMSDRTTGYRKVITLGNTNHDTTWTIKGLTGENYYWSVQAIDNSFEGSAFAPEQLISTSTFQLTVSVNNGWNMVSIPGLHPTDQNVNTWWAFRDPGANVFKYNAGYQVVSTAAPGTGYWMKHSGERTYNTGDEWPAGGIQTVAHDPLAGASGWNLFGGYELSVTAANVTTNPPGLQSGPIFGYSNGYFITSTLEPGSAYWIKLTGAGQIIIPETLAKDRESVDWFPEEWGRIVITDNAGHSYKLYAVSDKNNIDLSTYELPPAPPAGMFDIRYSSGRIAEDINSSVKTIDMSGVVYPLTVRVEGMDIRLMDESGKMLNTNLKSGEDVVISEATIKKLKVSGELIPSVYSLEQNFPNPFNPSTKIRFSIPKESEVNLSVFNILGERVKELKNEMMKAGYYEVEFDASDLASGVYLCRIKAGEFVETKKMILLR